MQYYKVLVTRIAGPAHRIMSPYNAGDVFPENHYSVEQIERFIDLKAIEKTEAPAVVSNSEDVTQSVKEDNFGLSRMTMTELAKEADGLGMKNYPRVKGALIEAINEFMASDANVKEPATAEA